MVYLSIKRINFRTSRTLQHRFVNGSRRSDHITPILKDLHWLPVEERINFKIPLITYKILHDQSPKYLESLIEEYSPPRMLRSSKRSLWNTPTVKSATYGDRAFSSSAPKLWNNIPEDIKSAEIVQVFKTKLKRLLFKKSFYKLILIIVI